MRGSFGRNTGDLKGGVLELILIENNLSWKEAFEDHLEEILVI